MFAIIQKVKALDDNTKILFIVGFMLIVGITSTAVVAIQSFRATGGLFGQSSKRPLQISRFVPPDGYTWQVDLAFDQKAKKLSVTKVSIMNKIIFSDLLSNFLSPYTARVIDKDGKALLTIKIAVNERLSHEGSTGKNNSVNQFSIFIPYFDNGQKILIKRDYKTLLSFTVPKRFLSFRSPFAISKATAAACIRPISIVVAGEGYSNGYDFLSDFNTLKEMIATTRPYKDVQHFFDINYWGDGTGNRFNCINLSHEECIQSQATFIQTQIGREFPDATHIILLRPRSVGASSKEPSGATMIGGHLAAIGATNTYNIQYAFAHEVLGHDLSYLNDRYIYPNAQERDNTRGDYIDSPYSWVQSNCSFSKTGQSFWTGIPEASVSTGCGGVFELYAPGKRDCQNPLNGPQNSVMGTCYASRSFDAVEEAWIQQYILPTLDALASGLNKICSGGNFGNNSFSQGRDFPTSGIRFVKNLSSARCEAGDCTACDLNECKKKNGCFVHSGSASEDIECAQDNTGLLPGMKKGIACGQGYCFDGEACSSGKCVDGGTIPDGGACCDEQNGVCPQGTSGKACKSGRCQNGMCAPSKKECAKGAVGQYCAHGKLFASYGDECGGDKEVGTCQVDKNNTCGNDSQASCAQGSKCDCGLYCVNDHALPNGWGCCDSRVCASNYCNTQKHMCETK